MKRCLWLLKSILCVSLMVFVMPLCRVNAESADQTSPKHILFISSYSYSWGTVPLQIQGIDRALGGYDYVINYEFMDTKNTVYSTGYKEFYDILKYKMDSRYQYDGLIIADDAALNFVELYKEDLFKDMPITFLGIDNVENGEKAAQDSLVTGIVEQVNYQKNIEIAHKLLPSATRITFILDNMENGVGIAKQLAKQGDTFQGYTINYLNTSEYTREELYEKLGSFTKDDIVFFVSMGQQKDGVILTENERYQMIRQYASVPMFRLTTAGVGDGALGGYVVDFEENGYIAGSMLEMMLEDPSAAKPALRYDTPGMYYFDYAIMQKYNLNRYLLPEDTKIINVPETFFEKYSVQINYSLLVALVIFLMGFLVILRRKQNTLKENNIELAQAYNAKTEFFSNMSHDLRTPMNGILGFTGIGLKAKDIDTKQQCLEKIKISGDLLLDLINDTLYLSRIDSGKMKLDLESFNEQNLTKSILATIRQLANEKGIYFIVDEGSYPHGCLMGDKMKLQKIILNLLSNAIKFTPSGGTVKYSVQELDSKNNHGMTRRFIVEDTGIGMSPDFINQYLFKPFSQEQRPEMNGVQGTGLGLSIVKSIVDLMAGTITVQSEIGKGTKFVIELPLAADPACQVNEKSENQALPMKLLAGKKVLLCEDNAINAEITTAILKAAGMDVEHAENGKIGVDTFSASSENNYDVILMDLRMPVMDGMEASKQIRNLPRKDASTVKIIALTADVFATDVAEAKYSGMDHFLTKPVDAEKLYKTLLQELYPNTFE